MALVLAPAAAHAATVSVTGDTLTYTAAPGEANNVAVAPWGLSLRVTDTGAKAGAAVALTAGTGCWKLSSTASACLSNVTALSVNLGDGNDSFDGTLVSVPTTVLGGSGDDHLSTGAGSDTLDGGPGVDVLDSGAGDDTLRAQDGEADSLICGAGQDSGSADRADSMAGDCESVAVPALAGGAPDGASSNPAANPVATVPHPGAGTNPASTSNAGKPNAVPPTIPPQTVAVSASGVAGVQLVCPPDSGGCRGTVTLKLPLGSTAARGKLAVAARGGGSIRLGQTRFTAKAGTAPTVRVRLSKRGRQRILRNAHSHCRISVRTVSADGTAVVSTQDVTLARRQPPRPARPPARPRHR